MRLNFGLALLASTLWLAACAASATPAAYTAASLRADLQAAGLRVTQTNDAIKHGFSIPSQRWEVNGENLYVYDYADPALAATEAAGVSPDGYSITRADHGQTVTRGGDWIATPHFYRRGRLIVIYAGDNASLTGALSRLLGAPFAGGQLLMQVAATPAPATDTPAAAPTGWTPAFTSTLALAAVPDTTTPEDLVRRLMQQWLDHYQTPAAGPSRLEASAIDTVKRLAPANGGLAGVEGYVVYSVQPAQMEAGWLAGNGVQDGAWVRGKSLCVRVAAEPDAYRLLLRGTSC